MVNKLGALKLKTGACVVVFLFFVFSYLQGETQAETGYSGRFDSLIESIAEDHGLEPLLIHSIIRTESDYDPNAVSPKGAVGLMQLMPETAEKYGVRDLYDPRQNILGGVKYLKDLISSFGRRTDYVLAAYNAGHNAMKKYGGIPPFPETRRFIQKVKSTYPHSTIRNRTKIYKYYDNSGRVVFTNSSILYSQNKKKRENEK